MEVTEKETASRDEEDDDVMSLSLYNFQDEKKALCRSVSEEVVFEQARKGPIHSEEGDRRNSSPKSTIMNNWGMLDEEEKKEDALSPKGEEEEAQHQQRGQKPCASTNSAMKGSNADETDTEKVEQITETYMIGASPGRSQATATSSICSPLQQATGSTPSKPSPQSPPPLLTPDVQKLLEISRRKGVSKIKARSGARLGARKGIQIFAKLEAEGTIKPSPPRELTLSISLSDSSAEQQTHQGQDVATTPVQSSQRVYSSEARGTQRKGAFTASATVEEDNQSLQAPVCTSLKQHKEVQPTTRQNTTDIDEICSDNNPGPSSTTSGLHPSDEPISGCAAMPLAQGESDEWKTAVASPPQPKQSVVSVSSEPSKVWAAAPGSPSRSRQTTSTASPPKSRLSTTEDIQVSPSASRASLNTESLATRPGLANTTGLARQGGAHNVGSRDSFGVGLTRQGGSHHLSPPKLPVQDGISEMDLMQPARQMKHPPVPVPEVARLPSDAGHGDDDVSSLGLSHPEAPLISDSKLKSLFQNAASDHGIHQRGHANAPRGLRRSLGPLQANYPGGVPKTVRVGPPLGHPPKGIRNRLPGVTRQRKGAMVPEEILQHAEFANKMNQRRLRQKLMQHQPLIEILQKSPPLANIPKLRQESGTHNEEMDIKDDELDISNAASEDYDLGSFVGSPSFALAARVFNSSQRRPSDPSIDPEIGSIGGGRRRQSVMNKCIASADLNAVVSEPKASIARRSRLAAPQMAALGMRRRGLQKTKSKLVMLSTAAFQQSNRSGMSSVTMGSEAVHEAVIKAQERTGLGRSPVASKIGIQELILDSSRSTHSSVGWNSASNRTLDVSAHLNACAGIGVDTSSNHNYHSELQPHLEGDSLSTANQSRSVLDATSAVSPPSREEMRRRRASLREEPPGELRPSPRSSLPDIRVPTDAASVASSRISAGTGPRRTSRASNHSVPGLRHNRPLQISGAGHLPLHYGSKADFQIAVPRGMKERFVAKIKEEREKEEEKSWNGIMDYQNDIVMELACAMSKTENKKQVLEQQRLHLHMQKGSGNSMVNETGMAKFTAPGVLRSRDHHLTAHPCLLTSSLDQRIDAPKSISVLPPDADSIEAALRIALQDSRHSGLSNAGRESDTMDPALRLAFEASMQEFQPKPVGEDDSVEQALLLAIEQSKKESTLQVARGDESDRALELALEMSLVEAKEHDRIRQARQLYATREDSLPEGEPEKVASPASESSTVEPTNLEGHRTLEVAMKLSKEEHDYEVSKRQQKQSGRQGVGHGETARENRPSHPQRRSTSDSAPEYRASAADALGHRSNLDDALGRRSTLNDLLAMPSEILGDDGGIGLGLRTAPVTDTGLDEALSLAMAVSKGDAGDTADLSPEESMAYALELSRRAPGAHCSMEPSNERPQPRQSSTPPRRDQSREFYREPPMPQHHQLPHALPYAQQGYLHHYDHSPLPQLRLPHLYSPPQPYYAHPTYQAAPVAYQVSPYQPYHPHLHQPHMLQPPAYAPQYYQPIFHQPYSPPPPYEFNDSGSVGSYPAASSYRYEPPTSGSFGNTNSFSETPVSGDDAALKLALELSRQDAHKANINGARREIAASADEKSLLLALELSRRDVSG